MKGWYRDFHSYMMVFYYYKEDNMIDINLIRENPEAIAKKLDLEFIDLD